MMAGKEIVNMTKFLFIFRSESSAHYRMTPEQMQQNHERWQAWLGEGMRKGWLVNVGDGLQSDSRVVNAEKAVTDGPFVEGKEVIGGFSIVQSDNIDAAAEIAKGCPMFEPGGTGGTVEVRPLWGFALKS
jgi:hypothetical protein